MWTVDLVRIGRKVSDLQISRYMAVWLSANIVGLINEVIVRRAGLVLRWVTLPGYHLN